MVSVQVGGFLSTLSLRRATFASPFSIFWICHFYPRSPCGERRVSSVINDVINYFYPRSPCGERPACIIYTPLSIYFYPRSPCGERPG